MRNLLLYFTLLLFIGCATTNYDFYQDLPKKGETFSKLYEEIPHKILIMPPINRSTNVEAKDYFYSTLNTPLSNSGYYVFPPFLTYYILQSEGAYDAENFINSDLSKFKELIDADAVLFTQIDSWNKYNISAVEVEIEYFLKSTKTNRILFHKKADITVNTQVETNFGDYSNSFGIDPTIGLLIELIADLALSATNTALTENVYIARSCNNYALETIPFGKYHINYGLDKESYSGQEIIKYYFK